MKITNIEAHQIRLPLVTPFQTSYGSLSEKAIDIIVVRDDAGHEGYGELVAFETANYIDQTISGERLVIAKELVPLLTKGSISHPSEVSQLFASVRGHEMAKSALETAVWDLFAKRNKQSLGALFQVETKSLKVGISLGIEPDITTLLKQVSAAVTAGYERVKLKIKPGYDKEPLQAIRQAFPSLILMADGNSAYTLADQGQLKKLDDLSLAMIEQPLGVDDFVDHVQLQKAIKTPICLDENIRSLADVRTAYHLGSCQSINLKIPRVGGVSEALKILNYCQEKGIHVWLGGMFESGIGRSLNIQFAAQPGFAFPGDISASERYFKEDIITSPFMLKAGALTLPTGPGLGVSLNQEVLARRGEKVCLFNRT